ncbi:MAG: M1 family metallopeptidase [Planctomycetota bacterium]
MPILFRVVFLAAVVVACVGCASSDAPASARERARSLAELSARFASLDLPAASEVRLGSGKPGPDYWQQRADYAIDARVDPVAETLSATGRMRYTNNSPHALDALWFNLEQNRFRQDSDGFALSARVGRTAALADFDGGFTTLVYSLDGEPLPTVVEDTLARVILPEPIAPGASIEIGMEWAFPIPPAGVIRMGSEETEAGMNFLLAQWIPQVANYDDVSGWNTLPYLGSGEFYTNFGDYDVSVTVPRGYLVAATGELVNPSDVLSDTQRERLAQAMASDETVIIVGPDEVVGDDGADATDLRTWRYRAEMVRTFCFSTSASYMWDAASLELTPEHGPDAGETRRVLIQSFYPEEGLPYWEKSTEYLRFSTKQNSEFFTPYPYPQATNVNGPVGGMEYPMILFCRGRESASGLFGVTAHEIGHNWFPMMVNTDERRHPWMDEGFTTFADIYQRAAWEPDTRPWQLNRYIERAPQRDVQPVYGTRPDHNSQVGFLAYRKPAYGLYLLREYVLGPERFDRAFRGYVDRWAFKSPQPADFFRSMEDVAGTDLAWFWRGWFYGVSDIDQAIESVEVSSEGVVTVSVRAAGRLPMPVVAEATYDDGATERYRLPVEAWATREVAPMRWVVPEGRTLVSVTLDPDAMLPDWARSNNKWSGGS